MQKKALLMSLLVLHIHMTLEILERPVNNLFNFISEEET
jgi:hypothetical protein